MTSKHYNYIHSTCSNSMLNIYILLQLIYNKGNNENEMKMKLPQEIVLRFDSGMIFNVGISL